MASIISAGTTSGTSLNLSGDTSGVLQLATNGSTTAVTVDTSQNVGIGTTSPATKLQISESGAGPTVTLNRLGDTSGNAVIRSTGSTGTINASITLGGGSDNLMTFATGTSNTERGRFTSGGYFKATNNGTYNNVSGSNHEFYNSANAETLIVRNANASFNSEALIVSADRNTTNNSYYFLRLNVPGVANRLLIADSGSISTAGSVQLGDAGAPPTSGVGIKFPATQSASSDANTLDDYEEGTWTPSYGGGITAATYGSARAGTYIKIGRSVTVHFVIMTNSVTRGSGSVNITGLPFTSSGVDGSEASLSISNATRFDSNPPLYARVALNSTTIALYSSINATGAGADPVAVVPTDLNTGSGNRNIFVGTVTYFTG